MTLTDREARQAKPRDRDYKLADSRGLYLFVRSTGHRSWRLKYRFAGKEKILTIGPSPEVSLAKRASNVRGLADSSGSMSTPASLARRPKRLRSRAQKTHSRRSRGAGTSRSPTIGRNRTQTPVIESMERDLFAEIGSIPIAEIDPPLVLSVLRPVEQRGAVETAHRLRQRMSAVFVRAISEGICRDDPAATVTGALKPMSKKTKQSAIMGVEELRLLLRTVETSTAEAITKLASRMIALTVVRPAVIRGAAWIEFEGINWEDPGADAAAAQWRIPADRMKLEREQKFDSGTSTSCLFRAKRSRFCMPLVGSPGKTPSSSRQFGMPSSR